MFVSLIRDKNQKRVIIVPILSILKVEQYKTSDGNGLYCDVHLVDYKHPIYIEESAEEIFQKLYSASYEKKVIYGNHLQYDGVPFIGKMEF